MNGAKRKRPHLFFAASLILPFVVIFFHAFPGRAATIAMEALLDGSQAVPPITTAGRGSAMITFDTVTKQLTWQIAFSGLSSYVTSAHFQGPAQPGQTANILFSISAVSGLESPMIGSVTLSSNQEIDLLAELWYINIRTGLAPSGEIRGQVYVTDRIVRQRLVTGDFNSDGRDDLLGLTRDGRIYYTLDLANWIWIPGTLALATTGDLNGDGKDDIIGLTDDGQIFYTLDLSDWIQLPGTLFQLTIGDLNGDGKDDVAGVTIDGQVYYTLDLQTWQAIPGVLEQLTSGDLLGSGFSDLAALDPSGNVYVTFDLQNWLGLPGRF